MHSTLLTGLTALSVALAPIAAQASEACSTDAMIVFDGSASMAEAATSGTRATRIDEARKAVAQAMPFIAPFRKVGLMIYGPGEFTGLTGACSGVELRFAPQPDAGQRILEEIQLLRPSGLTALTQAVEEAADVLDYQRNPGLIVLVTDGNETCGGSPCQLAAELSAAAADLTVHVIGFHVRASDFTVNDKVGDGATAAECLPVLNSGKYVHTDSVATLAEALEDTLGCETISGTFDRRSYG